MMKIVGIIVAAVLAVVVVTTIWGGDDAELTNDASDVNAQAEATVADPTEEAEVVAEPEPVEEVSAEPMPAEAEPVVEEAEAEPVMEEADTEAEVDGTEPVILLDDEALATEVEAEAEAAADTELAGTNDGLAILEEALQPESFDYEAVQQAISDSAIEVTRKEQLATALERASRYPAIRDSLLEDIRAELGVE
ncbi:hypothetical protein [uncultured Limimaricola sp.]|uniref:hypothetical protein n=1 Tax=uncultured Limimaricola sp. TaxID=2211667 RepID=UPI0030F9992F